MFEMVVIIAPILYISSMLVAVVLLIIVCLKTSVGIHFRLGSDPWLIILFLGIYTIKIETQTNINVQECSH